jgi:hypothetical protein
MRRARVGDPFELFGSMMGLLHDLATCAHPNPTALGAPPGAPEGHLWCGACGSIRLTDGRTWLRTGAGTTAQQIAAIRSRIVAAAERALLS